jgi:lactoylglutathione lyase
MIRVSDLEQSLDFWCNKFGLIETRRKEFEKGRFTLIFLAASADEAHAHKHASPELELTFNWDGDEVLETGRSWGHLAYRVDDIYATCQALMDKGVTINRPPHDGHMAFIKSPDNVSIELIQEHSPLPPQEPWASMTNTGSW